MEACRPLRTLLISLSSMPTLRNFSTAAAATRSSNFFSDESGGGGSAVYRHALKFQRPNTIPWQAPLVNSVSFIGTIDRPLQKIDFTGGKFAVHTLLKVKTSPDSNCQFWVFLRMLDEMAEVSIKHLKPNDFIYVSGKLRSFPRIDKYKELKLKTMYKVIVKEINYVAQSGQKSPYKQSLQLGGEDAPQSYLDKRRNRLHLWQMFFGSPNEWWDNRKKKVYPNSPDFRHKDTRETLWLSPDDPPWIAKQLQLHDSRLAEYGAWESFHSRSHLSQWVDDDDD